MKLAKAGLLLCLLLAAPAMKAQNNSGNREEPSLLLWEEQLEQLSMEQDGEYGWEDELEELSHRLQEPINLNVATKQQLEQLPFLSDIQIENLLAYVYLHGEMQSLYELQLVSEMDKRTIGLLLPFVCVQPVEQGRRPPTWKNLLKYGRHEALARLDVPFYTRKGYEKAYLGPSLYHSLRYGFRYGDYLQAGITGEKDAGEPLFALHNKKGYDYYSYYLLLKGFGRLKALALGNYRLSFGQGLVMSTDFRLGKSFSFSTAGYRTAGLRKHSSTDEYNYFRGAAATVAVLPCLDVSAFYSHRSLDGVVDEGRITSLYKTGLHRTQSEAAKADAFALQAMGGNATYEKNLLRVGVTGVYYFFDRPYEPRLRNYAKYNLHGTRFYNVGVDYRYRWGRLLWTGEAATGTRGYALLNRLEHRFSADYRLMLLHRYYSHDYWALFGRAFGEGSTPQNENGWYLAAEATPFARWKFFASADLFSFPWWKYRISKPSQGVDVMFQAAYTPGETCSMYLNYRYKQKERDVSGTSGEDISPIHHHKLRYRLTALPGHFTFRTTLDYNHFRQQDVGKHRFGHRQGWQCTQLASYAFSFPLSVSVQGTWFDTDDYDSRIYVSERGLLNTFYTPSFYGRGFRYSVWMRYDLGKRVMFLAKFGQTLYQDRESIGSGNEQIVGNKKADLQMQLRLKF